MVKPFNADDFDQPVEPPPSLLYKYLVAERVRNVLEEGTVRFTPLISTNDIFEVRATFKKIAGPRFIQFLLSEMEARITDQFIEAEITKRLSSLGLASIPYSVAKKLIEQQTGEPVTTMLKRETKGMLDHVAPHLNDQAAIQDMLSKLGNDLLCFSLSERFDSPPMWAHYAGNHSGFIVGFNTSHEWFQRDDKGTKKSRLQKVAYVDGQLEEVLENPHAAFGSKTTDWSYEKEWRLYSSRDKAARVISLPDDEIHLFDFPSDAVRRIVIGHKASSSTVDEIVKVAASSYPSAELVRAIPDRTSHTYRLQSL
ncbi:hypothetical protein J2X76_004782 [Neorhizobium sp. 2083]|uniref:DUF2971 domain-containing protein n=1 Tax=Neorhizobium sp. 2083 TaxID=2817762 RepID=UPI0028549888|nr:DUF2971 domain-containing protein [Neorhizobium sp. 2083]MDR6819590.1 hypothetical protein [Neorhizobium sp. 2083]